MTAEPRLLYSCTHMAAVGVKGLSYDNVDRISGRHWLMLLLMCL